MNRRRADPVASFWSRVNRANGDKACWIWTGAKDWDGYGLYALEGRRSERATRIAWRLIKGERVPKHLQCLHTCDNPGCVNPAHIFLGTTADNMRDRDQKGRQSRGSFHPKALLTEAQVIDILNLSEAGLSQHAIARRFGVSRAAISGILLGRNWKHVTGGGRQS
jgi:hypothetical protein